MRLILTTLAALLFMVAPAAAGDDGLLGQWKFHIYESGQQTTFWLLKLERNKDNNLSATAEPLKGAPGVKVNDIKVVGDVLTMNLKASFQSPMGVQSLQLDFEARLPKPGAKKILGTLMQGNSVIPAVMEATSAKTPFEVDREILLRTPSDPKALSAIIDVIAAANANKVDAKDLQDWVNASMKTAELYGPRMQARHGLRLLEAFGPQKAYASVAAETARKISKNLDPKTPLDAQLQMLSTVANVLRSANQPAEAKELETRLEKLEGQAYVEYEKSALNYKIEKFAGRKAKSKRAVLVELFTGAQCPPCVAADMAFDGLEKTYGPGDVVLLQYHMHIPRPEPMSNPDSDARFDFYAEAYAKQVRGTPASLFNGKPAVGGGGSREDAGEKYKEFVGTVNKMLEVGDSVNLSATAARKADKIEITAKVESAAKEGKLKLRFALVEDWVRYKGGNALQYHHNVVRAMPGGAKGIDLKDNKSDHKVSVDLDELRKKLNKYLDDEYPEGARPMRLRNLHVVAFVQSDESTEVLQAIRIPVREE